MGLVQFFRSVYDLGTLDTRFTTKSNTPYEARHEGSNGRDRVIKPDPRAQPSKWAWPEFRFYTAFVIGIVPVMYWIANGVSKGTATVLLGRDMR